MTRAGVTALRAALIGATLAAAAPAGTARACADLAAAPSPRWSVTTGGGAAWLVTPCGDRFFSLGVNVLAGARSFYRWQGAIESAQEWLLVIKTSRVLFEGLRLELEKIHSYEIPEVIALPIVEGSPNYLLWLEREVSS